MGGCPIFAEVAEFFSELLRPAAPHWKGSKPDLDRLARAAMDGLSGSVLRDDALVVSLSASKRYCTDDELPGALITLIPQIDGTPSCA